MKFKSLLTFSLVSLLSIQSIAKTEENRLMDILSGDYFGLNDRGKGDVKYDRDSVERRVNKRIYQNLSLFRPKKIYDITRYTIDSNKVCSGIEKKIFRSKLDLEFQLENEQNVREIVSDAYGSSRFSLAVFTVSSVSLASFFLFGAGAIAYFSKGSPQVLYAFLAANATLLNVGRVFYNVVSVDEEISKRDDLVKDQIIEFEDHAGYLHSRDVRMTAPILEMVETSYMLQTIDKAIESNFKEGAPLYNMNLIQRLYDGINFGTYELGKVNKIYEWHIFMGALKQLKHDYLLRQNDQCPSYLEAVKESKKMACSYHAIELVNNSSGLKDVQISKVKKLSETEEIYSVSGTSRSGEFSSLAKFINDKECTTLKLSTEVLEKEM